LGDLSRRWRLITGQFCKGDTCGFEVGINVQGFFKIPFRLGSAVSRNQQLSHVVLRFRLTVDCGEVGHRTLVLPHFDEDGRRIIAVKGLIRLHADCMLQNGQRLVKLPFTGQAQTKVVQRRGLSRIRGHRLLVEAFRQGQLPETVFHARGCAEQIGLPRPLHKGSLKVEPGLHNIAPLLARLGEGNDGLRRCGPNTHT
jgi:hypothetical protein